MPIAGLTADSRAVKPGFVFAALPGTHVDGSTFIPQAIAAGADCVIMGGAFAGTEEAPGEVILYQGRSYKSYRGMGSLGAMSAGSADRYFQESGNNQDKLVPEGIEGRVAYKGNLHEIVYQFVGGLKAGMGYCGAKNIKDLQF